MVLRLPGQRARAVAPRNESLRVHRMVLYETAELNSLQLLMYSIQMSYLLSITSPTKGEEYL